MQPCLPAFDDQNHCHLSIYSEGKQIKVRYKINQTEEEIKKMKKGEWEKIVNENVNNIQIERWREEDEKSGGKKTKKYLIQQNK